MWQEVPCPLCGADDARVRWRGALSDEATPAAFACTNIFWSEYRQVVTCRRCGMTYNNPCETPATLLAQYADVVDEQYLREQAGRERTFAALLTRLRELQPPPGTLLDVGCYTGQFAAQARAAGYTVCGLEPSRWAATHARDTYGLEVAGATLTDLPADRQFDCITLWDVLEHLPQPHTTIAAIARHLRPGGLLALSTHNLDAPAARLLGGRYPFLMRMHVAHFTPATLGRLLAEHGLYLASVEEHRRYIRIGYALDKLARYAPRLHALLRATGASRYAHRLIPVVGVGLINAYARRAAA